VETPGGDYVAEYRGATGFDRGLPARGVLIREQRNGRKTYLVVPTGGNPLRGVGNVFTDSANFLRITVTAMAATTATLEVNTAFTAAPVGLNGRCGDKFRGVVLPCASGLTCMARRSGILVSTEFYCQ
jgi:hypothetical protein